MENIEKIMDELHEEFEIFKSSYEKKYVFFVMGYFLLLLGASYFVYVKNIDLYSHPITKIIFLIFIVSGLIVHFILKNTFFRKNKYFEHFMFTKLDALYKEEFKDEILKFMEERKEYLSLSYKIYVKLYLNKK